MISWNWTDFFSIWFEVSPHDWKMRANASEGIGFIEVLLIIAYGFCHEDAIACL
jgi:hypothetical protein